MKIPIEDILATLNKDSLQRLLDKVRAMCIGKRTVGYFNGSYESCMAMFTEIAKEIRRRNVRPDLSKEELNEIYNRRQPK